MASPGLRAAYVMQLMASMQNMHSVPSWIFIKWEKYMSQNVFVKGISHIFYFNKFV